MSKTVMKDYEEVVAVLNRYVEGGNVSSAIMKAAFHPDATVNAGPAQNLFDAVDKAGKTDSQARVDVLDIAGNVACARVVMEGWHGLNFVDFHVLMKTDDGWKIVSKVYHQYE